MQTRSFIADLDHLHEMLNWIRVQAEQMSFGSADLNKIELAAEEAIVNVIHHSYEDKSGQVTISTKPLVRSFEIIITDSGQPFNPLTQTTNSCHDAPLDERQMGGLGLLFMRKCLDEINYERKNNHNILTLIKKYH